MARDPILEVGIINPGTPVQKLTTAMANDDGILRTFNVLLTNISGDVGENITDMDQIYTTVDQNDDLLVRVCLKTENVEDPVMILSNPKTYGFGSFLEWYSSWRDESGNIVSVTSRNPIGQPWIDMRTWVNRRYVALSNALIGKTLLNLACRLAGSTRTFSHTDFANATNSITVGGRHRLIASPHSNGVITGDETTLIGGGLVTGDPAVIAEYPNCSKNNIKALATTYLARFKRDNNYSLLVAAIRDINVSNTAIIDGIYKDIAMAVPNELAMMTLDPELSIDSNESEDFMAYISIEMNAVYDVVEQDNGTYAVADKICAANALEATKAKVRTTRLAKTAANPFPIYRVATEKESEVLDACIALPRRFAGNKQLRPIDLGVINYYKDDKVSDKFVRFCFTQEQVDMMDITGITNPYLLAIPNTIPFNDNPKTTIQATKLAAAVKFNAVTAGNLVKFEMTGKNEDFIKTANQWGLTFYLVDSVRLVRQSTTNIALKAAQAVKLVPLRDTVQ